MTAKPQVEQATVLAWLSALYESEGEVQELRPLDGGYWSSAFAYQLSRPAANGHSAIENLVLRLGASPDGYRIDQQAYQFSRAGLPVPEVLEVGEALGMHSTGMHYAISRRLDGQFLETANAELSVPLCATLVDFLATLRNVSSSLGVTGQANVEWYEPPGSGAATFRDWLNIGLGVRSGLGGSESQDGLAPWRHQLRDIPDLDALFERTLERIGALLQFVPERRYLIHGDLLHQNVLINKDATAVTGIFSWKCSAFGDYLYDLAWCTLWSSWFPALDADLLWKLALADIKADPKLTSADLKQVAERHHCYELQIAASHLGWFITSNDVENRARIAVQIDELLNLGPRTS